MMVSVGRDNIVAFLETSQEYMMSQVATAQVVEQRMEPITRAESTQPLVVTGQYLAEQFLTATESDKTRMGIIRQLSDIADAQQIKGACDKMVELARDQDYPEGKPKKAERKSKEQQAMNARTIIQQGWGALHFARSEAEQAGYDDTTGYLAMRVIAKKALDMAQIDWQGEALKTDVDRERARLARDSKTIMAALQEVQKENPYDSRVETLQQWNARTFELAAETMVQAKQEMEDKIVNDLFTKLLEKHGEDRLIALAEKICNEFNVDFTVSEPSEQEALDAMANVSEEQAAH
jgi:hypothetical protein